MPDLARGEEATFGPYTVHLLGGLGRGPCHSTPKCQFRPNIDKKLVKLPNRVKLVMIGRHLKVLSAIPPKSDSDDKDSYLWHYFPTD